MMAATYDEDSPGEDSDHESSDDDDWLEYHSNYTNVLASYLNRLRKEETLCDITIVVNKRRFPAHKVVLCAASAYFSAMLTSGFQEACQSEITIEGNSAAFERLLDFVYSGELRLNLEIVGDIMTMASYMQFNKVLPLCCHFLKDGYDANAFDFSYVYNILNIARSHELNSFQKHAENYLAKNLIEFAETSTFLKETSPEYVESVLKRKDLGQLIQEEQILKTVVAWLKQDWDERRQYAEPFLRLIRLGLVPLADLNQLIDADIQAIPECKKMIEEVVKCLDKLALKDTNKTILACQYPHLFASTRWTSADQSEFIAGPWERVNRFANADVYEKLDTVEDFAVCPNGDMVVTSYYGRDVYMYSNGGRCKSYLNLKQGMNPGVKPSPFNVTVNADGIIYVTCNQYVLMYTAQGVYKDRWVTMSPDNKPSDSENIILRGLTIDSNGQVLVGQSHPLYPHLPTYISKHRQDGIHIASFMVAIAPVYLATTSYDTIVIGGSCAAHIVDGTGQVLHTLTTNKELSSWSTRGVCFYNDIIFVCNSSRSLETFELACFSVSGKYLGSIAVAKNPRGVTIAKDKLLVLHEDTHSLLRCFVMEYFHTNRSQ